MNKFGIIYFSSYCKKMGYTNLYNYHYFYQINKYILNDKNINNTYNQTQVHVDVNTIYKNIRYPKYTMYSSRNIVQS